MRSTRFIAVLLLTLILTGCTTKSEDTVTRVDYLISNEATCNILKRVNRDADIDSLITTTVNDADLLAYFSRLTRKKEIKATELDSKFKIECIRKYTEGGDFYCAYKTTQGHYFYVGLTLSGADKELINYGDVLYTKALSIDSFKNIKSGSKYEDVLKIDPITDLEVKLNDGFFSEHLLSNGETLSIYYSKKNGEIRVDKVEKTGTKPYFLRHIYEKDLPVELR